MKKVSLVLIALLLCLSMLLVSCDLVGTKEPEATKPATNPPLNNPNENTAPVSKLDKAALIAAYNAIDLGAMLEELSSSETESPVMDYAADIMAAMSSGDVDPETLMGSVLPMFADLAAGVDASVTMGQQQADATVAIKDGMLYFKAKNVAEGVQEGYLCFGKGELKFFAKTENGWEEMDLFGGEVEELPEDEFDNYLTPTAEFDEIENADMMAMVKEMIAAVVIPELKDEHLIEENGMLVLNNEYLVELMGANASLIAYGDPNYEMSAEDLEDGLEEIRTALAATGLKIEFGGNGTNITKFKVSFAFDDSEAGQELKDTVPTLIAGSVELGISADGQRLNACKISVTNDFSEFIGDYQATSVIEQKYIYDDAGVLCGVECDIDMVSMMSEGMEYEEDNNYNYVSTGYAVATKIDAYIKVDLSKIGKANQDVFVFDLDMNVDKVSLYLTEGNWMNDEENTEFTEVSENEYDQYAAPMDISLKLTATDANKLALKGEVKMGAGEDKIDVAAVIYLNDILNVPTSIPNEVTAYMAAE